MEAEPSEYIWQYNPVTGRVVGASQNFGARINTLHASPQLWARMQQVQRRRNETVTLSALQGSGLVPATPSAFQTTDSSNCFLGGSDNWKELLEPVPESEENPNQALQDLLLAAESEKDQRNRNLTQSQFVSDFPPVVYERPFTGSDFPLEFSPLYSPDGNQFTNTGWISQSFPPNQSFPEIINHPTQHSSTTI
ncbi:pVIII [Frog adenovirus 1]|uniref:PVIII n=1 Tax=Frog adenovirus 1 (strain ATCC VR-896) TaxID=114102 RepID=Q9IIG9_ADEF1|nr:pVIII [Frog adenovirus 1]AAF86938.1 pVIII [Frog adenovirus 1]